MIPWPVTDLIPHAGDMVLLDHVLAFDTDTLQARATVRADGLFSEPDGSLPNWMGLEIMAQAVAAWAGCHARAAGRPVELGFLLGTRNYECHVPAFAAGTELLVDVSRSLHDATGMGMFECRLLGAGATLAQARLNVFSPRDVNSFVQESQPPRST
ncbi:ApeP family dehydratase [Pseudothauera rhizosphaerae]|uniref:3-hydroxylacyl-ACP dehydratase n=1 Tax=Pseudothauera rhizosphaerae TaxID=2565932 RepID=A0A4S4ART3_9RHOO|nr:hotdog family protein [Pseudothauera rhizosphaerae]THF62495.1 3-hydroxylacyl-ACP dehydratase [Pseudothauera rhizosphaerae]